MVNKRYLGFFLILLVLSLMVTPSYAYYIDSVSYHGSDNIEGISRDEDVGTIEVLVVDDENAPTPSDLSVMWNGLLEIPSFESSCNSKGCNQLNEFEYGANSYMCTCVMNDFSFSNAKNFDVKYKDSSKSLVICPDVSPPEIDDVSLKQIDGGLKLEYSIMDKANDNSLCSSKCSGIKDITLSDDEGRIKTIDINTGDCSVSDEVEINYNKNGEHTFWLTAKDRLWSGSQDDSQHSTRKRIGKLSTDYSLPQVSSSFDVEKNGNKIKYMPSRGSLEGDISFTFTEENPVRIDVLLRELGANNNLVIRNINQYCTLEDEYNHEYKCTVRNVNIAAADSYVLPVKIYDSSGNKAESDLTWQVVKDDEKPHVQSINTKYGFEDDNGRLYVNKDNNTFVISIAERKSGISKDNIYLDLSDIGRGIINPDNCTESNGNWVCMKDEIECLKNHATIYITQTSTDNVGNYVEGELSKDLVLDDKKPDIVKVEYAAITPHGEIPYVKIGDKLNVKVYVNESGSGLKTLKADFSELFSNDNSYKNVELNCEKNDNEENDNQENSEIVKSDYLCSGVLEDIESHGQIKINYEAYDNADNVGEKETSIRVYKPYDGTPDCFDLKVDLNNIPPIERTILTSLVDLNGNSPAYFIYVPIRLSLSSCGRAKIQKHLANCQGATFQLEEDGNGYSGFAVFALDPGSVDTTKDFVTFGVDSPCELSLYETIGGMASDEPEKEELSINVPIVGNIEAPEKKLREGIENALDDYDKTMKTLEGVSKTMNVMRKVCQIDSVFAKAESVIQAVVTLLCVSVVGKSWAESLNKLLGIIQSVHNFFAKPAVKNICALVTCKNTGKESWGYHPTVAGIRLDFSIPGGALTPALEVIIGVIKKGNNLLKDSPFGKKFWNHIIEAYHIVTNQDPKDNPDFNKQIAMDMPDELEIAKKSLKFAAGGACAPGILYNLRKDKELNCMEKLCELTAVTKGTPISECIALKKFTKCTISTDWGTVAVDALGIRNLVTLFNAILSNKVLWAYVGIKSLAGYKCQRSNTEACGFSGTTCSLYYAWNSIETLASSPDTLDEVKKYFGGKWSEDSNIDVPDYCNQLEKAYDQYTGEDEEDNKDE